MRPVLLRAVLLAVVCALGAPSTRAQLAPPLFARAGVTETAGAETIQVEVRLGAPGEPATRVYFVGFQLHFDPEAFEIQGATRGDFFDAYFDGLSDPLEVKRLVRPADDLDEDGQPDGASYYAYSIALVGNERDLASGSGAVFTFTFAPRRSAGTGALERFGLRRVLVSESDADPDDALPAPEVVVRVLPGFVAQPDVLSLPAGQALARVSLPAGASRSVPLGAAFGASGAPAATLTFAPLTQPAEVVVAREGTPFVIPAVQALGYNLAALSTWTLTQVGEPAPSATFCLPLALLPEFDDYTPLRFARRAASGPGAPWALVAPTLEPTAAPDRACARLDRLGTLALVLPDSLLDPLPVELTRFEARVQGGVVRLSWATSSETNNAGFGVEKQSEESGWREIGFVAGAGTTAEAQGYEFVARDMQEGAHRFRLRQVDYDGGVTYSRELDVRVEPDSPRRPLTLSAPTPNPASGPSAGLTLRVARGQHVRVALYDALGREVAVLMDRTATSEQPYAMRVPVAALAPGLYLVHARGAEGKAHTRRLVVQ